MNVKAVLNVVVFLGVALFASGCCTGNLWDYSKKKTWDTFLPRALYQATNSTRLAIEGDLFKDVPQEKAYAGRGLRQWLVLPDTGRQWDMPAEGKQWQWLHDNGNSLNVLAKDSTLHDSVPPDFQKVSDFPETVSSLPMPHTERRPHSGAMAWAPLTVTADIILSPFELIGYALLAAFGMG